MSTHTDPGVYAERLARARQLLHHHGLDFLLVGPSADLRYLLGTQQRPSERLAMLVVPQEGPAHMVLPAFEASSLPTLPPDVSVDTWGESDRPAKIVADLVSSTMGVHPGGAQCTVGVSDRTWAVFLLQIQSELPRAAFAQGAPVLSALRLLKTPDEISLLRQSGASADDVFREIAAQRFEGRAEKEIGRDIASMLEERGLVVEGTPIVASGPNSASPHHHTGDRVVQRGDVIVLDFGGTLEGYYSDITRTVFVGDRPEPGSEQERVYTLVASAQEAAFREARPGITCESLNSTARDLIEDAGYGQYFNHRLGHGIGLDGHEPPYLVQGNGTLLRKGMAFTIEPGVYLPGKFGVRVEDTIALTDAGAERLNNAPRDIVTVT